MDINKNQTLVHLGHYRKVCIICLWKSCGRVMRVVDVAIF